MSTHSQSHSRKYSSRMSVPAEFHAKPFIDAVTAAEITVGTGDLGLSPQLSLIPLYFEIQFGQKTSHPRLLYKQIRIPFISSNWIQNSQSSHATRTS